MLTLDRPPLPSSSPDDPAPTPHGPDRTRRRSFRWRLVPPLLVGAIVRAAAAWTDGAPSTDETAYLRSGMALLDGNGFTRAGNAELHFPPLIPFLSAAVTKVVGDPHVAKVLLTFLASCLLIVPLTWIARRIGGDRAGVVTAWTAALMPALSISMVTKGAGSEAEFTLLIVTALALVIAAARRHGTAQLAVLAAAGAAVGLAYLTRPEGLLLGFPLGLAVLVLAWRARRRPARALLLPLAFGLPVLAGVLPYAAYLHGETGRWELSAKTQTVSIDAWLAGVEGDRAASDEFLFSLDDSGLEIVSDERRPLTTLAREDPATYRQILRTNLDELGNAAFTSQTNRFYSWTLIPAPLLLLGLVALVAHRRSRPLWLLVALLSTSLLTIAIFFVQLRYLFLAASLLTVLIGLGLAVLRPRWLRTGAVAAAILLLVGSTAQGFKGPAGWMHPVDNDDQRSAGEWLEEHLQPGERIMTRSMVVEFYAGRTAMIIPAGTNEGILDYARHHDVTYLVADWYTLHRLRPQLGKVTHHPEDYPGVHIAYVTDLQGRRTVILRLDPTGPTTGERPPMGRLLSFVGDG